jgi:hypothetical protein
MCRIAGENLAVEENVIRGGLLPCTEQCKKTEKNTEDQQSRWES